MTKDKPKKNKDKKSKDDKKKKYRYTARTADKHVLYQESVQSPDEDARFFERFYKRYTGERLTTFREDFCGTAILSCEHVKRRSENISIGVDLHGPTLDWGRKHNLSKLTPEQRGRVNLIRANVLDTRSPKADLLAALNFSYYVFLTRDDMRRYIVNSFGSVKPGGVFIMDSFGGGQAQFIMKERRKLKGFTYVWDQVKFDPITHRILCKIHFNFRDGTKKRNAFIYDWRLWMLPELRELMAEAGFEDIHVLWEGTDRKTQEGNGVFRRVERGADEEAWIAYLVGRRPA